MQEFPREGINKAMSVCGTSTVEAVGKNGQAFETENALSNTGRPSCGTPPGATTIDEVVCPSKAWQMEMQLEMSDFHNDSSRL